MPASLMLFRSVVLPLALAALMFAGAFAVWRAARPEVSAQIRALASSAATQSIEQELARLSTALEDASDATTRSRIEAALAEERQRLSALWGRESDGVRTPRSSGVEERCESCHANTAICGLSHPREMVEALRRGESRASVLARFCATDDRLDAVESLVHRLCASPNEDPRDCEEDPELSGALDEAASEYCGGRPRRLFCSQEEAVRVLNLGADLLPPPAWARSHPEFGVLLGGKHPVETFGCTVCHDVSTLSPAVHGDEPVLPAAFGGDPTTRGEALHTAFDQFVRFARGELLYDDAPSDPGGLARQAWFARCADCHDSQTIQQLPVHGKEREP